MHLCQTVDFAGLQFPAQTEVQFNFSLRKASYHSNAKTYIDQDQEQS